MEAQRTEYRALLRDVDGETVIATVEKNMVDPAATKLHFQETLRADKTYVDLMNGYIAKAQVLTEKCKRKNADRSKTVRKLAGEIDELKIRIRTREIDVKKSALVYSFVPAGYKPLDQVEAEEMIGLLKKLKPDELLTDEKKIVKVKPVEQVK